MSLQELQEFTPAALCEYLGQGLTDAQCAAYLEYAADLKKIEHADFIAREIQAYELSIESLFGWLQEGIEGADLCAELVADGYRRKNLCLSELQRRERLKRIPKRAQYRDYQKEFEDMQRRSVEIIGTYTTLRKIGKEYSGVCIFHNDKTPSLRVNDAKGLWYCHGCGKGGNVYSFVKLAEARAI